MLWTRSLVLPWLIVLLLAGALLVGTAAPSSAALTYREKRLVQKINKARKNRGIPVLKLSLKISNKARNHSKDMAQKGDVYHSCLQCKFQGWNWHALGENVTKAKTVGRAHKAFMKSAPHRANILSRAYRKVGVGIVAAKGWLWVTELFYG